MDFNLNQRLKNSLNWLFPQPCLICNKKLFTESATQTCVDCYPNLPFLNHACTRCGQSIASNQDYCGACLIKPPNYDQCFCPFRYSDPIKPLIQQLKYGERPDKAAILAHLFYQEFESLKESTQIKRPDLLIPVPMHTQRLRKRGFNQSFELCKHISKLTDIPYSTSVIKKQRKTTPQTELDFKQRQHNLRNSFAYNTANSIKHIAIIDDVVTTGATATEITKTLKKNGVHYVSVWGVAHTMQ